MLARIDTNIDEVRVYFPVTKDSLLSGEQLQEYISTLHPNHRHQVEKYHTVTFDLPEAFISRYKRLCEEMQEMQSVLEQLYRHQEGMQMHPTPEIDIEQYQIKDRT